MYERFLERTEFDSYEDFHRNYKLKIPENFNFAYDVADVLANEKPNLKALCWVDDRGGYEDITFARLKEMSDRTASFFSSLGITRGDKVMLILQRRFEWWYAVMALSKLGACVIPATHLLTSHDIVYRNNAAGVKMVVAVDEGDILSNVDAARKDSPEVSEYVIVNSGGSREGWHDFNEGLAAAGEFIRPTGDSASRMDDYMLMYFTSGTTAQPKMVGHDHSYPLGHIVTSSYWHNTVAEGLHFTVSDTGWGKAAWGKLYGQWMSECTVFVYDYHGRFPPEEVLRMIQDYKITSFCAPPPVFRFMIREDFSNYNLSSLKYCTTAGEPLSSKVFKTFKELTGLTLMEGFGQTETVLSLGNFPWMTPKPGSLGKPAPGYDAVLVNADGEICGDGEEGQIAFRIENKPPGLFKDYYRNPELTSEVKRDGLYFTGDMASRDKDGYYWFVGRADDLIKSSGYKIGPFEVESTLMTHQAVVECAVTGVPDDVRGQIVKASIVLDPEFQPGDDSLVSDIQGHVKKMTAPYKYPRIIEFVEELPKTISGKIRRVEIRDKDTAAG